MKPYVEAVWSWFLSEATVPRWYGMDRGKADAVRLHMQECGIDLTASNPPELGTFEQFQGTFADNHTSRGLVADWWRCECGRYKGNDAPTLVISGDISVTEIVTGVIRHGEMKQVDSDGA